MRTRYNGYFSVCDSDGGRAVNLATLPMTLLKVAADFGRMRNTVDDWLLLQTLRPAEELDSRWKAFTKSVEILSDHIETMRLTAQTFADDESRGRS